MNDRVIFAAVVAVVASIVLLFLFSGPPEPKPPPIQYRTDVECGRLVKKRYDNVRSHSHNWFTGWRIVDKDGVVHEPKAGTSCTVTRVPLTEGKT